MSEQSEALKKRTMKFGVGILRVIEHFPRSPGGRLVSMQVARCATSVGSNYRAACCARSRREFFSKLCIVNEEADETVYWLEVARLAGYAPEQVLAPFEDEAQQLRAIFAASIGTMRVNRGGKEPMTR